MKCNKCGEKFVAEPVVEAIDEPETFDFTEVDEPEPVVEIDAGPPRNPSTRLKAVSYDPLSTETKNGKRPWQLRYTIYFLCRIIPTICIAVFLLTLLNAVYTFATNVGGDGNKVLAMGSVLYALSVLFTLSLIGSASYALGSLADHTAEIVERTRVADEHCA